MQTRYGIMHTRDRHAHKHKIMCIYLATHFPLQLIFILIRIVIEVLQWTVVVKGHFLSLYSYTTQSTHVYLTKGRLKYT